MLTLISRLFSENRPLIHGVAEAHPAAILNSTLDALGITFGGESDNDPADTGFLAEMARDERVEMRYWEGWKYILTNQAQDDSLRRQAVENIERAQSISLEERRMLHSARPETLYIEGCSEFPSSVIGFVAEREGARVVYLDEGFGPYLDWLRSHFRTDRSVVQKGRELHWLGNVLKSSPGRKSMLIAGGNHLVRPSPEDVLKEPSRGYTGRFPGMLEGAGINFSMYADLSRPNPG